MIVKKSNKAFKVKKPSNADRTRINLFDQDSIVLDMLRQEVKKFLVPTGTILSFAGVAAPQGFLLCDGASYTVNTYSDLHNVISDAYGGDGGTNFNVPDLRGRFLRGTDNGAGRDPGGRTAMASGGNAGDTVGSVQIDATKKPNSDFTSDAHNHSHPGGTAVSGGLHGHYFTPMSYGFTPSGNPILSPRAWNSTSGWFDPIVPTVPGGNHSHAVALPSDGHSHNITGGGDSETRPLNANVNYIIKI